MNYFTTGDSIKHCIIVFILTIVSLIIPNRLTITMLSCIVMLWFLNFLVYVENKQDIN